MTVKELIERLQQAPQDYIVLRDGEYSSYINDIFVDSVHEEVIL